MEPVTAVETRRPVKETPAERLSREIATFFSDLTRTGVLAAVILPFLLLSFLTGDLPVRGFDFLFSAAELKPGRWLRVGALVMIAVNPVAILIARRFGGDEAGRAIIAAWGVAAVGVFAELSYLAPILEAGDFPPTAWVVAFVGAAMLGQLITVGLYDVVRGGGAWWRAPLYGLVAGYAVQSFLFFLVAFWTSVGLPWLNWMVTDFAIKCGAAAAFLPLYRMLMRSLKPRGGFGG